MKEDEKAYEMFILTKVINTYLDKNISFTEEGLNVLVAECDDMVWNIATSIYGQSGHKVELHIIRDVINSRIEALKKYIATQKVEAYQRLKIQQAEEAERLKIQQAEEAEQAAEEQKELDELSKKLEDSGRDKNMSYLFLEVRRIVSEQLTVDLDAVSLDQHISDDLGADELDTLELSFALENKFQIEIPDSILGSIKKNPPSYSYNSLGDSEPLACTVGELLDFIYKSLSEN